MLHLQVLSYIERGIGIDADIAVDACAVFEIGDKFCASSDEGIVSGVFVQESSCRFGDMIHKSTIVSGAVTDVPVVYFEAHFPERCQPVCRGGMLVG
jgi:hypothetical protein